MSSNLQKAQSYHCDFICVFHVYKLPINSYIFTKEDEVKTEKSILVKS
jgi:hypothetical protein